MRIPSSLRLSPKPVPPPASDSPGWPAYYQARLAREGEKFCLRAMAVLAAFLLAVVAVAVARILGG